MVSNANDGIKAAAVSVVTAHGRQELIGRPDDRLVDVLMRNGVPWSAVSIYIQPKVGEEPVLCSSLDLRIKDFEATAQILLYFNRNVNPFNFSLTRFKTIESGNTEPQSTEYFYQEYDNKSSGVTSYLKKLSTDECRQIVSDRVAETIKSAVPAGEKLVVGVSGGGDSNALLEGLSRLEDYGIELHPIILKGIPDWDKGVPRAEQLCERYGLKLRIMEEKEVREFIGIPADGVPLIDRFEREFKGDDFEFLGTLLIRLALSKYARDIGAKFICTGLNLEDVLCENLFRTASGLKPASIPIRVIGDITLITPLWLCPKRIIDGCFPKLSLDNYNARYPCFSLGRNLYYSVVYSMQSQFPGFIEQMVRGLSEVATKDPVVYHYDDDLGFHVERFVPFPLRQKFKRMLGGSIEAA